MKDKSDILHQFSSIHLDEMNTVKLQNRHDTKFVFHQNKLDLVLEKLVSNYRVLSINDIRVFSYKNTYFDTENLDFYKQHHNKKRSRFKVRIRKYCSTDDVYFEVKIKNNKNRTIKKRININTDSLSFSEGEKDLIVDYTQMNPNDLSPKLKVTFNRITLVDNNLSERITIDTDLSVENGKIHKIFNNLVISEIKQNKYDPKSPYIQVLRGLKIPEMRFSKYCMGILHVFNKIKHNRFKPKLLQIDKLLK